MAEKSNISPNPNQAVYGLNTDSILQQVKPGTLTYALNAQVDSFDGHMVTYQNEQSTVLCSEFKTGFRIIGVHSIIEQDRTILFMTNPYTGESEIGELSNLITCDVDNPTDLNLVKSNCYVNNGYSKTDKSCPATGSEPILTFFELYKKFHPTVIPATSCCNYRTIINATCLAFNINYPIHKIVHRIVDKNDDANKCGTEIYWADGLNARRYINLDDLPFATELSGCDRINTGVIDCDLMEVQPTIKLPCIKPILMSDGGSLIAGTYQFAIQYTNDKGEGYTAYYSITNPVSAFRSRYGLDFNFPTDKAIKLLISNLDTKFKFFNLAVIKTINGVVDPELVGTYEILKETAEITYTGNNKTQINLTIDDIFEKFPYYRGAKEVAVVGDSIIWANLTSKKRINYQSIASAIVVNWQTWQIPYTLAQAYNNGINTALYKGYMRDEVYPLELVLLLKNGQQTDGFHIPARVSVPGDLTPVSSNDDVITHEMDNCVTEDPTQPKWKVYNTGTVTGFAPEFVDAEDPDCYVGPYEYGTMSYWESEKTYPCDERIWGDLAGQPIRHHKFPDNIITHIHDYNSDSKDKNFDHKIYPIGIKIDLNNIKSAILNSDLTDSEKAEIIGFRIVRGDRVNNKSVIAKGLLYNAGSYAPLEDAVPDEDQAFFYPNYPFNDLNDDDPFLTNLTPAGGSGFTISNLDRTNTFIQLSINSLDSLESLMPTLSPVCYTNTGICPGSTIIEITLAELADLQNLLFIAKNFAEDATDAIQVILDYYNDKISNGEPICQDDVASLTLASSYITDLTDAIDDITTSTAIVNFLAIVAYINTNAVTLSGHAYATEIFTLRTTLVNFLDQYTTLAGYVDDIEDNFAAYGDDLTDLATVSCDDTETQASQFSDTRFTFHSPDTHFYQPFLGTILKLETLEGGSSIGNFVQVKDHAGAKLMSAFSAGLALVAGIAVGALFALEPRPHIIGTNPGATYTAYYPDVPSAGTVAEKALFWNQQFKQLIDNLLLYKNYAYQYNAIGYYNQFEPVPNTGFKQRSLDKAIYLIPGLQSIGDIYTINNWKRESSVYFKTDQTVSALKLPNDASIIGTLAEDDSRVPYSASKQIYSNVLSYYASNKRKLLDQYGDIYSYGTVDTGYCGLIDLNADYTNVTDTVFGGDIFINRFGLKRKLSFFIDTAHGRPDGSDIDYSSLSNVGKVKYWYNTTSEQTPGSGFKGLMKSILGVPQSNLDGNTNSLFYQNGRIYLYSYGIPYFFVESEVNVDMRQAGNNQDKDFFPNVGNGIPNDWLQESYVPIVHDNYYIYNKTYSKQNKENFFSHLPLTFDPTEECGEDFTHRAIWSDPNKWRIYKSLAFKDLPKSYGKLTSIDTINNNVVMVRFENKTFLHNVLTTINTNSNQVAYLGNSNFFSAPPIDFGETDQGYAGSQHHLLLRTPAGHLYIDAKRGEIFLVNGTTPSPISEAGMAKWFAKNLPFEIIKFFPNVNIDNHFNGVGLTGVWDNDHSRFIITKLDYIPRPEFQETLRYDEYYGKFYNGNTEVLLEDPVYFCNRSWTISYHPGTKSWISFHSYIPNYYIGIGGLFYSGNNTVLNNQKSSIWIHNLIHTSYQVFYGKLEPYILEYPFVYKTQDEIAQNIKDYTTILEYYNKNDFYEINDGVYFNKAVLYNNQQTSGILNLYPKPKGELNFYLSYPKFNTSSKDIIYTKSDNFFNYNTFWDVVKNPNNHYPIWVDSCENKSIGKELNNDKFDYSTRSHQKTKLRAKELKVRHINDKFDRYKFISKFVLAPSQISYK